MWSTLLPLALIACGTGSENAVDPGAASAGVLTDGGLYRLTLTPEPDPPVAGDAALTILVEDPDDGAPIEGAAVEVEPWMPSMGHGVSDPPVIAEEGAGVYRATWEYSMPGTWEVVVTIDESDSLSVTYEVG